MYLLDEDLLYCDCCWRASISFMISLSLRPAGNSLDCGLSLRLIKNSRLYRFLALLLSGFQKSKVHVGSAGLAAGAGVVMLVVVLSVVCFCGSLVGLTSSFLLGSAAVSAVWAAAGVGSTISTVVVVGAAGVGWDVDGRFVELVVVVVVLSASTDVAVGVGVGVGVVVAVVGLDST